LIRINSCKPDFRYGRGRLNVDLLLMALLDLEALRRSPVTHEPFSFTIVRDFVPSANAAAIRADFPLIAYPGLLPVEATDFGPHFGALIEELRSEPTARAFSEMFDIDLIGCPMMVTVRGRCQQRDGRIHTDSTAKLVTALLYSTTPGTRRAAVCDCCVKPTT
jgi:hypothetical protein